MCGRYSFAPSKKQADSAELRKREQPANWKISFNIAPTQSALVVANDQPDLLQTMTWGLVPHWSRDGANSGNLINARAEGIEEKPSFRQPLHSRRCWVPADSFYEWRTAPNKKKLPYRILAENGDLLFLAGIWDEWKSGDERKRTFSIITTTPNQEMSELHNRMPVLLTSPEDRAHWLSDIPVQEALALLHAPADGFLKLYRVSEKLNKPSYDEADLHEEVVEALRLF